MSLLAAELERKGISTTCIVLLREVAEKVRPPRALCVPFRHGYPLDRPNDAEAQKRVLSAALSLVQRDEAKPPLLVDY